MTEAKFLIGNEKILLGMHALTMGIFEKKPKICTEKRYSEFYSWRALYRATDVFKHVRGMLPDFFGFHKDLLKDIILIMNKFCWNIKCIYYPKKYGCLIIEFSDSYNQEKYFYWILAPCLKEFGKEQEGIKEKRGVEK